MTLARYHMYNNMERDLQNRKLYSHTYGIMITLFKAYSYNIIMWYVYYIIIISLFQTLGMSVIFE